MSIRTKYKEVSEVETKTFPSLISPGRRETLRRDWWSEYCLQTLPEMVYLDSLTTYLLVSDTPAGITNVYSID